MLNNKQIIEYAMKGITSEIEELEKTVKQGYKYVEKIDKGEKVTTTKTKFEILDICREANAKIKKLEKEHFELKWQLCVDEN